MTLALFNWSRTPDGAQLATWGRYSAILAHHRSGAWTVDLYHGTKRTRREELSPDTTAAEARTTAEQFLLDEQGPEVRELVCRARAAEGRGAGTVSLRAVGGASGGKRRKAMGTKQKHGKLKDGYAYSALHLRDWRTAPDEMWDTVMISNVATWKPRSRYLGERTIDGARCAVFEAGGRGHYYAQTVATTAGKRRHASPARRPSRLTALVADLNRLTK